MQKIIEGISAIPQILQMISCRKLLLVADTSFPYLNIREAIESLPVEKVVFSDFTPNPQYQQVCNGVDLMKVNACDAIMAVGGGSAMDMAKCIKLSILADEGTSALIPPLVSRQLPIDRKHIPLIAIPTTAGTGSESTHNAVMYYEGAKQTITNDGILPDYAILEPSVLETLPLYQKKCTMMDALCQGIESWWSVNSTDESKICSKKSVKLIMKNWRAYIFDNDSEAAKQIMLAANYAGRAINISATTAAHAMSYKLTSLYKLPHGHAVAVCLPVIWEYMLLNMPKCIDSRGEAYLQDVFDQIALAMEVKYPDAAIKLFCEAMEEMQLGHPIAVNKQEELEMLSNSVNPIRLKNNPVPIDYPSIVDIYDKILL